MLILAELFPILWNRPVGICAFWRRVIHMLKIGHRKVVTLETVSHQQHVDRNAGDFCVAVFDRRNLHGMRADREPYSCQQ